ncbi:short chain dehydrogenase family protein [Pelomyxa schiedti]|nr:short chain dehydrogenase family protein [Pelomyxa schiedti]
MLGWLSWFIGVVVLARALAWILRFVVSRLRGPSDLATYKAPGTETWAVVTGASQGIGEGFARALAARQFNLVLYALGQDLLAKIAADLTTTYKIKVIYREVNFVKATQEDWDQIARELEPLNVGVLVNSAGVTQLSGKLDDCDWPLLNTMIQLNVAGTTRITHLIVPKMLKRGRTKSLIINMGSSTALIPSPMLQVYGATKAYIKHFSTSLADEYRGKIDVTCCAPWWVCTPMTEIRHPSLSAITPSHFANCSLCHVGKTDWVDPYWVHALIDLFISSLPHSLVAGKFIAQQTRVRAHFLRKRATAASTSTTTSH